MDIRIRETTVGGVDTHKSYNVIFFTDPFIHTIVTQNPTVVTAWIDDITYHLRHLGGRQIVGLDVEFGPIDDSTLLEPVATLQLCVAHRCLIYQISHADFLPDSLAEFLYSREVKYPTFVGVGVKDDLDKLHSEYDIGGGAFYEDLREAAAASYHCDELKSEGLEGLASVVFGRDVEIPEAVTLSRWDRRWLTEEQVKYACVDAYLSYQLGKTLLGDG